MDEGRKLYPIHFGYTFYIVNCVQYIWGIKYIVRTLRSEDVIKYIFK